MKTLILAAAFVAISAPVIAQSVTPVAPITPIADAQRGTMVVLQGKVDRITDEDEFHLRDDSGWIEIEIGSDWVPVNVGEQITVQGYVDDDYGLREVYARSLTRADGSVIIFDRYDD